MTRFMIVASFPADMSVLHRTAKQRDVGKRNCRQQRELLMRWALTIDCRDDTFHKGGFLLHYVASVSMAVRANNNVARKFTFR